MTMPSPRTRPAPATASPYPPAPAVRNRPPRRRSRPLARAQREDSRDLVALLTGGREEDVAEQVVDTLGSFCTTSPMGLMAQWAFDPEWAPEAEWLTEGLRRLIDAAAADVRL